MWSRATCRRAGRTLAVCDVEVVLNVFADALAAGDADRRQQEIGKRLETRQLLWPDAHLVVHDDAGAQRQAEPLAVGVAIGFDDAHIPRERGMGLAARFTHRCITGMGRLERISCATVDG